MVSKQELREKAEAVMGMQPVGEVRLSPRAVARCLSGVVTLVCRTSTVYAMQRACAELVRDEQAWQSGLAVLPRVNGRVDPVLEQIAVVARGILPSAGEEAMKSALSFWATESDPAVWQRVSNMAA